MAVIKKTVAIHPIMDKYIRATWSTLIEKGFDATYSTAANYMWLYSISVQAGFTKAEVNKTLNSFLNDPDTIKDLNLEDYAEQIDKIIGDRDKGLQSLK